VSAYRLAILPHVAEILRHFPPALTRPIKSALQALGRDPALGEPLQRELEGLWKYRAKRFRIVYAIDRGARVLVADPMCGRFSLGATATTLAG
jgi:mRNA interferase RelE/StbE